MISIVQTLDQAIDTQKQRGEVYGKAYKRQGDVMSALFPNGVSLDSKSDFARFSTLNAIVNKLVRYSNNFDKKGHEDSLLDMIVYVAILRELDTEEFGEVEND